MKILVTGAAGYIGRVTRVLLERAGHTVIPTDRWPTGGVMLDLIRPTDAMALAGLMRETQPDVVLHLAALCHVGDGQRLPIDYWRANVGGTANLLAAMAGAGVSRLVFASSGAVYGETPSSGAREAAPLVPLSVYGQSKKACEDLLFAQRAATGLKLIVLRYSNVAGAAEGIAEPVDSPRLLMACLRAAGVPDLVLSAHGGPAVTRSYVHVADVAVANVMACEQVEALDGLVGNVSTGMPIRLDDLVRVVQRVAGLPVVCRSEPGDHWNPVQNVPRPHEVLRLGWRAEFDLDRIVADAWKAFQARG